MNLETINFDTQSRLPNLNTKIRFGYYKDENCYVFSTAQNTPYGKKFVSDINKITQILNYHRFSDAKLSHLSLDQSIQCLNYLQNIQRILNAHNQKVSKFKDNKLYQLCIKIPVISQLAKWAFHLIHRELTLESTIAAQICTHIIANLTGIETDGNLNKTIAKAFQERMHNQKLDETVTLLLDLKKISIFKDLPENSIPEGLQNAEQEYLAQIKDELLLSIAKTKKKFHEMFPGTDKLSGDSQFWEAAENHVTAGFEKRSLYFEQLKNNEREIEAEVPDEAEAEAEVSNETEAPDEAEAQVEVHRENEPITEPGPQPTIPLFELYPTIASQLIEAERIIKASANCPDDYEAIFSADPKLVEDLHILEDQEDEPSGFFLSRAISSINSATHLILPKDQVFPEDIQQLVNKAILCTKIAFAHWLVELFLNIPHTHTRGDLLVSVCNDKTESYKHLFEYYKLMADVISQNQIEKHLQLPIIVQTYHHYFSTVLAPYFELYRYEHKALDSTLIINKKVMTEDDLNELENEIKKKLTIIKHWELFQKAAYNIDKSEKIHDEPRKKLYEYFFSEAVRIYPKYRTAWILKKRLDRKDGMDYFSKEDKNYFINYKNILSEVGSIKNETLKLQISDVWRRLKPYYARSDRNDHCERANYLEFLGLQPYEVMFRKVRLKSYSEANFLEYHTEYLLYVLDLKPGFQEPKVIQDRYNQLKANIEHNKSWDKAADKLLKNLEDRLNDHYRSLAIKSAVAAVHADNEAAFASFCGWWRLQYFGFNSNLRFIEAINKKRESVQDFHKEIDLEIDIFRNLKRKELSYRFTDKERCKFIELLERTKRKFNLVYESR